MAHPFNREKTSNKHLATNKANKNQITPIVNLPHGVSKPCGSAHKSESVSRMTGFHPSPLVNAIKTAHKMMKTCVHTNAGKNLLAYFLILNPAALHVEKGFEK